MRNDLYGRALLRFFGIPDWYDGPLFVAVKDVPKGTSLWVAKNPKWGEPGELPLVQVAK